MRLRQSRRNWLQTAAALTVSGLGASAASAQADSRRGRWNESINQGLEWLSRTQSSRGQWNTQVYPTALAALAVVVSAAEAPEEAGKNHYII